MPLEWINSLRESLAAEYSAKPRVATIATVDDTGRPTARSIVCRDITNAGSLIFISDARTHKSLDLRAKPDAEVVFWLWEKRLQFRLAGKVSFETEGQTRQAMWERLSDAARAMFSWPTPGAIRESGDAFVTAVAAHEMPPDHFELLVLDAGRVERLDLNQMPHERVHWIAEHGWASALLNP